LRIAGTGIAMEALINIDVPNLEQAIRFYEQGIGLRLSRKLFGGTVAEMMGASSPVYLLTKPQGSAPTPRAAHARTYQRHGTPVNFVFVVNSLAMAIEKAQEAGAKLEVEPQSFAWGSLATLSDPFGHGLCFLQWSGRGYDEVA
jgi:predicted enzyme related to lactoylglutathione lyase